MGKYDNMSLEELGKVINETRVVAATVQTELRTSRAQYTEKANEVKALGVNPETIDDDIKKLEKEYNDLMAATIAELPLDIIEQYRNRTN